LKLPSQGYFGNNDEGEQLVKCHCVQSSSEAGPHYVKIRNTFITDEQWVAEVQA
jgi:hypothetical protein